MLVSDPIPVLFQSGYLTLKEYNPFTRKFTLGFPNGEVREGFAHRGTPCEQHPQNENSVFITPSP